MLKAQAAFVHFRKKKQAKYFKACQQFSKIVLRRYLVYKETLVVHRTTEV